MKRFPFFSQFASADLIDEIVHRRLPVTDDPRWSESGATTVEEYGMWARAGCGMACLQMILAASGPHPPPLADLASRCESYGGYRRRGAFAEGVDGLLYAGFVAFAQADFGLTAEVAAPLNMTDLVRAAASDSVVIASVHHSIRWPDRLPPTRGGHLVLVFDANHNRTRFNNPSGHSPSTQKDVVTTHERFSRFHAERGILVTSLASP